MVRLTAISPVAWTDLLDFAGTSGMYRKAFIAMASRGQVAAFADAGELVAIAFLVPVDGSLEFCVGFKPRVRVHMRELVRLAHLTLGALAETGHAIHAHILPGNRSGERMARLAGFVPDGSVSTLWRYVGRNGEGSQKSLRRRQQ